MSVFPLKRMKSYSHMNSYVRFHPNLIEIILKYEFTCPFSP